MGWLFGKKKIVPRIPLPEGYAPTERTLQFPTSGRGERIIEPDKVKEAAGVDFPFELPPMPSFEQPAARPVVVPSLSRPAAPLLGTQERVQNAQSGEPVYVKVEAYQRILGELETLKKELQHLDSSCKHLDSSEYNEEHNFEKLRRAMKLIHDRLLHVDKRIFNKITGE
ncbi:MAG: hypothetical protein AABX37_04695 [Nanoarchaeota archaeon]